MGTQLVKTGRFQYSDGGTVTVNCGSNLHNLEFFSGRTRYEQRSDDLTLREIVTVGDPVPRVRGMIRYHDDPVELDDMIQFGLDGGVLTYSPDGGSTEYSFLLLEASEITPDERRIGFGEYKVTLTLEATGSTTDLSALASLP